MFVDSSLSLLSLRSYIMRCVVLLAAVLPLFRQKISLLLLPVRFLFVSLVIAVSVVGDQQQQQQQQQPSFAQNIRTEEAAAVTVKCVGDGNATIATTTPISPVFWVRN